MGGKGACQLKPFFSFLPKLTVHTFQLLFLVLFFFFFLSAKLTVNFNIRNHPEHEHASLAQTKPTTKSLVPVFPLPSFYKVIIAQLFLSLPPFDFFTFFFFFLPRFLSLSVVTRLLPRQMYVCVRVCDISKKPQPRMRTGKLCMIPVICLRDKKKKKKKKKKSHLRGCKNSHLVLICQPASSLIPKGLPVRYSTSNIPKVGRDKKACTSYTAALVHSMATGMQSPITLYGEKLRGNDTNRCIRRVCVWRRHC